MFGKSILGYLSLPIIVFSMIPVLWGEELDAPSAVEIDRADFEEGLSDKQRAALLQKEGGTTESQAAVTLGLQWIVDHQLPTGAWSFDHRSATPKKKNTNWGNSVNTPRAATSMGLLPMLSAGNTHRNGVYKDEVKKGLEALVKMMKVQGNLGSFEEPNGTMYSHGLGSLVLCEAYLQTKDRRLLKPTQTAINNIVYAQDPVGGGWRYIPKQAGDGSVIGWQIAPLFYAQQANLKVPEKSLSLASSFLDSKMTADGVNYGYVEPQIRPTTSAIGLLSRAYLGKQKTKANLQGTVQYLSKLGPSKNDMYFNYFATLALFHYGGSEWSAWNQKMREHLIQTQVPKGNPEAGSWYFDRQQGSIKGGRLYNTSLALMILEVYYSHPRINMKQVLENKFQKE